VPQGEARRGAIDLDERRLVRPGSGQHEVVDREAPREQVEIHVGDRGLASGHVGDARLGQPPNDDRKRNQRADDEHDCDEARRGPDASASAHGDLAPSN
jgi:hypothetical protein